MINITCFNNKRGLSYKSLRNGLEEIPPNWFRVKICHLFFSLRAGGFNLFFSLRAGGSDVSSQVKYVNIISIHLV